jgi:hypothetical protein
MGVGVAPDGDAPMEISKLTGTVSLTVAGPTIFEAGGVWREPSAHLSSQLPRRRSCGRI